ncbi:hypothetical protein KJ603_02050 [Patescibacteria group bacterium]|nr:hypothetical protein [Patescibacteria group bacterium]
MDWSNGNPVCPECGQQLKEVRQSPNSYCSYSPEQFEAAKAGDFECLNGDCPGIKKIHPDKLANNGHRCYWLGEVLSPQKN